jgi:hypothetical protein
VDQENVSMKYMIGSRELNNVALKKGRQNSRPFRAFMNKFRGEAYVGYSRRSN